MKDRIKVFKTKQEAAAFKKGIYGAELYYYAANNSTKDYYIVMLEKQEGEFDEAFAQQFPYMISWIE